MPRPRLTKLFALSALCAMLAACATSETQSPGVFAPQGVSTGQPPQLKFRLASGVYRCELGQKVEIQRTADRANSIELSWQGNRHTLQRYDSTSGLPRYEDRQNGLLWIDLPWKSVLMDVKSGRPLATECKVTNS